MCNYHVIQILLGTSKTSNVKEQFFDPVPAQIVAFKEKKTTTAIAQKQLIKLGLFPSIPRICTIIPHEV